jgi:Amiloride-sensitive sodium channel
LTNCDDCVDELRYVGITRSNVIPLCYFQQVRFRPSQLFEETVTEEGICYTFNGIKTHRHQNSEGYNWTVEKGYTTPLMDTYPRRAIGTGVEYSLNVFLGLCVYDFDYICRNSAQGFKVRTTVIILSGNDDFLLLTVALARSHRGSANVQTFLSDSVRTRSDCCDHTTNDHYFE